MRVIGFLSQQIGVFLGLALLVFVFCCAAALGSWHAQDPSLSYASSERLHNLMGAPGALYADLSMQFLGLAGACVLLPLFFWALLLLAQRPIPYFMRRLFFFFLGVLLFSTALALLPPLAQWPLASGLGGVVGAGIKNRLLPFMEKFLSPFYQQVLVVFLMPLSLWFLVRAGGATVQPRASRAARDEENAFMEVDDRLLDLEEGAEDPEEEQGEIPFLHALLGYFMHLGLRFKSFIKKSFQKQASAAPGTARLAGGALHGASETRSRIQRPFQKRHGFVQGQAVSDPVVPQEDPESGLASLEAIFDTPDLTFEGVEKPKRTLASTQNSTPVSSKTGPLHPQKGPVADQRASETAYFEPPYLEYLAEPKLRKKDPELSDAGLERNAQNLSKILEDFGVQGKVLAIKPGPIVTLYEFEPAPGIKSSRIIGLSDDIARSMSAISARVAVVPGRNAIGIEIPNKHRNIVYLREVMESEAFAQSKAQLALALGKTIEDEVVVADLAKMPHLLVAGTTGSGKSVAINTMILSLLYRLRPDQCRLIMVDPKMLELSVYDGIPHLLTPVVTDPKKAVVALKWAVREMEDRYRKMAQLGVRNIHGFNQRVEESLQKGESLSRTVQTGFDKTTGDPIFETQEIETKTMPYIVVIIDEMADLMMVAGKEIEGAVQRLAQMARAAGIHVIMATQRPSVDVITGTIKANFPTRISFAVTSKIDSRTILGEQGAEQLLGQGDMLFMMGGGRIQRVHGPFVGDDEVEDVVRHLKAQGRPDYLEAVTQEEEPSTEASSSGKAESLSEDPYDKAVDIVLRDRKVSTSYIQRRLGIGYNRAASIIERMEQEGLISAANHVGKREILVPEQEEF